MSERKKNEGRQKMDVKFFFKRTLRNINLNSK